MVTLVQISGELFFFSQKEFIKFQPLSGVGISLSISSNLNDLVQIRVFYGKLSPKFPIQKGPTTLAKEIKVEKLTLYAKIRCAIMIGVG
jgi:hypothetical protein